MRHLLLLLVIVSMLLAETVMAQEPEPSQSPDVQIEGQGMSVGPGSLVSQKVNQGDKVTGHFAFGPKAFTRQNLRLAEIQLGKEGSIAFWIAWPDPDNPDSSAILKISPSKGLNGFQSSQPQITLASPRPETLELEFQVGQKGLSGKLRPGGEGQDNQAPDFAAPVGPSGVKVLWGEFRDGVQARIDLKPGTTEAGLTGVSPAGFPEAPASARTGSGGVWVPTLLLGLWVAVWPSISRRVGPGAARLWKRWVTRSSPGLEPEESVAGSPLSGTTCAQQGQSSAALLAAHLDLVDTPVRKAVAEVLEEKLGRLEDQSAWICTHLEQIGNHLSDMRTRLAQRPDAGLDSDGLLSEIEEILQESLKIQERRMQQLEDGLTNRLSETERGLQHLHQTTSGVYSRIGQLKSWADNLLNSVQALTRAEPPAAAPAAPTPRPRVVAPVSASPVPESGAEAVPGQRPVVSGRQRLGEAGRGGITGSALQRREVSRRTEPDGQDSPQETALDRWSRLRGLVREAVQDSPDPSVYEDILAEEETFHDFLVARWSALQPPEFAPHVWRNGDWLSDLDRFLYGQLPLDSAEGHSQQIDRLLEELRTTINRTQQERVGELSSRFGVSRLVDKRMVPGLVEADLPSVPTQDARLDGTVYEIVPGRGGYRWAHDGQDDILCRTRARLYVYRPGN